MAQNRPNPKKRGPAAASRQSRIPPHTPHCRCGTPLHPDHVEKHGGKMLERYDCPNRRWWNSMFHTRAWMEPRDGVSQ